MGSEVWVKVRQEGLTAVWRRCRPRCLEVWFKTQQVGVGLWVKVRQEGLTAAWA